MPPSSRSQRWTVACRQWQGARSYQEDDYAVIEDQLVGDGTYSELMMVLADGMGGEVGGAQASRAVIEAFIQSFPELSGTPGSRFGQCLNEAGVRLRRMIRDAPDLEGMGSTVVAAHYDGEELTWLSVGDSPMWLFSNGGLNRLNADHSMAQALDRMVEDGELTVEEARNDRTRNMLLSAVTGGRVKHVDRMRCSFRLRAHDCLVIASDGIKTLSDDDIKRHLGDAGGQAEAAADLLLSAVQTASGPDQDNLTFLLLYGEPPEKDFNALGSDAGAAGPRQLAGAGKGAAAMIWKGMGLGLFIGLLAVAVSLWWWPDGTPARDITSGPQYPPSAPAKQIGETPVAEHARSVGHIEPEPSEPGPLESRIGATANSVPEVL